MLRIAFRAVLEVQASDMILGTSLARSLEEIVLELMASVKMLDTLVQNGASHVCLRANKTDCQGMKRHYLLYIHGPLSPCPAHVLSLNAIACILIWCSHARLFWRCIF